MEDLRDEALEHSGVSVAIHGGVRDIPTGRGGLSVDEVVVEAERREESVEEDDGDEEEGVESEEEEEEHRRGGSAKARE